MALTMPFINTLPAFDVNVGLDTFIYVLGGDSINGYQFSIYDQNINPSVALYVSPVFPVSNDMAEKTIRSFPIQISQFMGIQNNHSYKIEPKTFSTTNLDGLVGTPALFECYTTPTIKLQYLDFINDTETQYIDFNDNVTVPASSIDIMVNFNANDLLSNAQPNYAVVNLYGITSNGDRNYIGTSQNIYIFEHDTITDLYTAHATLSGFTLNVDESGNLDDNRIYDSFSVSLDVYTIENMVINVTYTGIKCYYKLLRSSPFFTLQNICNRGVIEINCSLTSLQGTSNIPLNNLVYPNSDSVDLNKGTYQGYNEAWVQWQNYFVAEQPYTLRIWGKNFVANGEDTTILNMTSSVYSGYYIKLDYKSDNTSRYIALSCGRVDNSGDAMFPYYIESEHIPLVNINENTNLFIGVQQQGGLFDINFQILT